MDILIRTRHHCNEGSNGLANLPASKNILYIKIQRQRRNFRRPNQWKDGQIEKLLVEAKTIQEKLFKDSAKNQSSEDGKVNKALKLLESSNKGGILRLTEEIFEVLLEKLPKTSEASNDILIQEEVQNIL